MKIVLLLADVKERALTNIKNTVVTVLDELEVELEQISLETLPYFNGNSNEIADNIVRQINDSTGIIAYSNVYLGGMHGAMQTFLNYISIHQILDKPLLTITYSNFWGEIEAGYQISKAWRFLGGSDGGCIAFNSYISEEDTLRIVDKQIENFYRSLKQGVSNIISSERMLFTTGAKPQVNNPVTTVAQPVEAAPIATSTPQYETINTEEKEIEEITNLLKGKIGGDTNFQPISTGTYARPQQQTTNVTRKVAKRIASLPHYFIAQYDKSLNMVVQYIINDTKEMGYIVISNGDCRYNEGMANRCDVEIMLLDTILEEIIIKSISYQKAFMVGKIKVKGNFALLPKLDQIFRSNREYN
ncbi:MAG: hypothetical protein BEN19_03785 [Epulopiscium sp. Nuni2H_MBin003]|nr:MAG: hypothetical protein BEN19_03785 [Epulopiscium sp. Nuni2H_MBin003]